MAKLWDINTNEYEGTIVGATDQIVTSDYSAELDILAVGSWDTSVRLYNLNKLPEKPTPEQLEKLHEQ